VEGPELLERVAGGVRGEDATGRLDAVELRHANVHQHDGGAEARDLALGTTNGDRR
jgi:hypothetical protein